MAVEQSRQLRAGDDAAEVSILRGIQLLLASGSGLLLYPPPEDDAEAGDCTAGDGAAGDGAAERLPTSSLLHVAAEWAPAACLAALLDSENASEVQDAMATADSDGDGPLQRALAAGRAENASLLLERGSPDAGEFRRPVPLGRRRGPPSTLHDVVRAAASHPRAKRGDYPGCVRLLLQAGGRPIDQKDSAARTPLVLAAELGCGARLVS